MTKQQLVNFIDQARCDEKLRARLVDAEPEAILEIASQYGFDFSDEIKGRFINRWSGVYSCPNREDIDEVCPRLKPEGFSSLREYSQSTCSPYSTQEKYDFRSGKPYPQ